MTTFRDLCEQAIEKAESIRISKSNDGPKKIVVVPSPLFCEIWKHSVRECWGIHNERRRVSGPGGVVFVEGADPDLDELVAWKMRELEPEDAAVDGAA